MSCPDTGRPTPSCHTSYKVKHGETQEGCDRIDGRLPRYQRRSADDPGSQEKIGIPADGDILRMALKKKWEREQAKLW
jgi:hypothetical protein